MSAPDWFESCGPDSFPEPVRAGAQPVQQPAPVVKDKDRDLCQKCLGFGERYGETCDCGDGLEPAAPVAAPVAVPAASVHDLEMQKYIGARLRRVAKAAGVTVDYGDDEFYYAGAFSILGDIARVLEKTADDLDTALTVFDFGLGFALCHRDFGDTRNAIKKLQVDFAAIVAAIKQKPDIGRDAALEEAVAMRWPNGRGRYYYADMGDTVTEAVLDSPELEYLYLAAHPANVAQVVELSDAQIDAACADVWHADYQDDSKGYERAIARAILDAAKKEA